MLPRTGVVNDVCGAIVSVRAISGPRIAQKDKKQKQEIVLAVVLCENILIVWYLHVMG